MRDPKLSLQDEMDLQKIVDAALEIVREDRECNQECEMLGDEAIL